MLRMALLCLTVGLVFGAAVGFWFAVLVGLR